MECHVSPPFLHALILKPWNVMFIPSFLHFCGPLPWQTKKRTHKQPPAAVGPVGHGDPWGSMAAMGCAGRLFHLFHQHGCCFVGLLVQRIHLPRWERGGNARVLSRKSERFSMGTPNKEKEVNQGTTDSLCNYFSKA